MSVISIVQLEQLASKGWPGTETRHIGEWLARAGSGFTGRANSLLPLGSAGLAWPDALDEIRDFYHSRSLPAVFQIPLDAAGEPIDELDRALADLGWEAYHTALVMAAEITAMLDSCAPRSDMAPAKFETRPSAAWLDGYLYRGSPLPQPAIEVLCAGDAPVFASITDEAGQAAVARGIVTDGWMGITAVTVAADRRRRGIGRHLMGELARWGQSLGAENVYLQVDQANAPALNMYEALGLRVHHRYHYRREPGS